MRKVAYTFIFGDYDTLVDPKVISVGWDYICFTNQPLKSKVWKIVQIKTDKPNHIIARELLIYPYDYLTDYDLALSISGRIAIESDLNEYPIKLDSLNVLTHPDRNCVYAELMQIALRKKDTWINVKNKAELYHRQRMPQNNGLYATGIMVRDLNNTKIKEFCKHWVKEINIYCFRDQVSLAYCIWRYKFEDIIAVPYDILFNKFLIYPHKK